MFLIETLEYMVFKTPNLEAMTDYYQRVLGLVKAEGSTADEVLLGVGGNKPALILRKSAAAGLGEVGFTVRGEKQWEEIQSRLTAKGIPFLKEASARFGQTVSFDDCDGHPLRLHFRQDLPTGKSSYRFGPLLNRLQHITYASPNPRVLARFYEEILNFRISDMVEGGHFIWLRTDMEHHTVAVAAHKTAGLDHYAFELPDWASFKEWCDHLAAINIDVIWGPGRHGPGNNLFFFTLDPDGNRVEYSCELEKFRDDYMNYTPRVWKQNPKTVNLWGPGAPWPRELP